MISVNASRSSTWMHEDEHARNDVQQAQQDFEHEPSAAVCAEPVNQLRAAVEDCGPCNDVNDHYARNQRSADCDHARQNHQDAQEQWTSPRHV